MATWLKLDQNPATQKICTSSDRALYQLHNNGRIWRYTGTPITGWELIDQNPATVDIVGAAANTIYQRHRDGKIWRTGEVGHLNYSLVITSVRCVDETEHEGVWPFEGEGVANEAMRLKVVTTSQKTGQPVEQQTTPPQGLSDLGSNYQDGTVVPMELVVANVELAANDSLPMSISAGFFLIEEDWLGDLSGIEEAIREYAKATREVHGTLSAIISQIPGTGWQKGSKIGAVASVLEPAIANAVLAAANDVFPLSDVSIVVPDRNAPFGSGAESSVLHFVGHGGEYEISYLWRVIETVPPSPCEII
ncbi:hypothetical protein GCM10023188_43760 [Pontibacter saemangeumensis]|uniref:Uncharacterized protein n=1 Tax=Pontibacter saemangeumensis TaxID=1084525 RepID=A0ABP8M2C8_9BACT